MFISPRVRQLITTTGNSVDVFTKTFESLDENEQNNFIKEVIDSFWPENITEQIEMHCTTVNDHGQEDWVSQYGDQDVSVYKLFNNIGETNYFDPEDFAHDIAQIWEERRDREIVRILEIISLLGFRIPYLPYIRDPENQNKHPHTLTKPPVKSIIKGIRSKYSVAQLTTIYKFLEANSYIEEGRLDDFIKCFTSKLFNVYPEIQWIEDNNVFYALLRLMYHNFTDSQYAKPFEENRFFINVEGETFQKRRISKYVNAYLREEKVFNFKSNEISNFFISNNLIPSS